MEIETTPEELEFRKERFKVVSKALGEGEIPKCTACHKSIPVDKVHEHPLLEVLMCEKCRAFYDEGEFSSDEDGSDKYCRWCGQGGSLYCCNKCPCVFCRACIKRNCNSSVLEDIEQEDWKCFVCDVKPLWKSRAYCWAILEKKKEDERLKKSKYKSALEKLGKQKQATRSRALPPKNRQSRRNTSESEPDIDDPNSDYENRDSASSDASTRKKSRRPERPSRVSTRQKPDNKSSKSNLTNGKSPSSIIEISSGSDFEDPKPASKKSMKKVQEKKTKNVVHSDQSSDDKDSDFKVTKKRGKARDSSSEEERPSRKNSKSMRSKPARRVPSVANSSDSSDEENELRKRKTRGKKKEVSSDDSDAQPHRKTKPKNKKQDDSEEDRQKIKSKNSNVAKNKDASQSTKKKQKSESESSGDEEEKNKSKTLVSSVTVTSKQNKKHQEESNKSCETSAKKTTSKKQAESVESLEPCTSTGVTDDLEGAMDSDATSKDGDSDTNTPKLEWLGGLISEFARIAKENNGKISQLEEKFSDNMMEEDVHDVCKIMYKQVKKSMKFLDVYKTNIINDYTDWKRKGERRKLRKTKTKRLQSQSKRVSNEPSTSADKLSKKKGKAPDKATRPDDTVSDQVESEEEQSSDEAKEKGNQKQNVTFAADTSNNSREEEIEIHADDNKDNFDEDWEKKIEEDMGKSNRKDKSKIDKRKTSKKKKATNGDESHTEDEQFSEKDKSECSVDEEEAPPADDSQVSVDKDLSEASRPASLNSSKDGSSETAVKNSLATLEEEAAKLREQLSSEKLDLLSKTLDSKHGRASIDPFSECDLDLSIQDKSTVCGDDVAQEILEERQDDFSDAEKETELSHKVVGEKKSQKTHSREDNSPSNNSQTTHFEENKSDSQNTVLAEVDKSKGEKIVEKDSPQEADSCFDKTTQEFLNDTGEESVAESPSKGNGKAIRDFVATDICGSSDSEHDMDVSALISEAGSDSDARKEDEECKNALIAASTDEEADTETLASSQKSTPLKKKRIGPKSKVHRNKSSDEERCNSPGPSALTKNKIGPKSKVPGSKGETKREQSLRKSMELSLAEPMIDARKEDEECKNALIAASTDEEADTETLASSQKSTPLKKKRIGPKSKVHRNKSSDEERCNSPGPSALTKNKIGPKSKVPGSKGETKREQSLRKSMELSLAESIISNIDEFNSDRKLSSRCSVTLDVLPGETTRRSRQKRTRRQSGYSSDQEIQNLVNMATLEKSHKKTSTASSSKDGDADKPKRIRNNRKKKMADEESEKVAESGSSDGEAESEDKAAKLLLGRRKPLTEDELAAKAILVSSDSDELSTIEVPEDEKKKKKKTKATVEAKDKAKKNPLSDSEESDIEKKTKKKASWRNDPVLREKISDSDSAEEDEVIKKVQNRQNKEQSSSDEDIISIKKKSVKKKKVCRKVLDSDDEIQLIEDDDEKSDNGSSDDFVDSKKKKKKRQHASSDDDESSDSSAAARKKRRRRIKQMSNSDSDSDAVDASQRSEGTPGKRKNIRKVLKEEDLERATRNAAKEEEERKKRIAERQKLYNEMFDSRQLQEGEGSLSELVLDFDPKSKKTILEVHKDLVAKLKPHQAQGVKFMWDALFESVERAKKGRGSGCILAHCMGLGKTMQIVVLVHTLLANPQLELGIRTVLVVTPLSTVNNWCHEFSLWLHKVGEGDEVQVFNVSQARPSERAAYLKGWQKQGGVAVMGYDLFRNLSNAGGKRLSKATLQAYEKCLVNPGADLVVCDEGHLLKNESSKLSQCMSKVKTMRRVVLTGTPLQNNLLEYHCMIQFVKPNLLGKRKEFTNRFVNPIKNGQCLDSTPHDVQIMKRRAHVLHKMLEGSVQRFDYTVLTPLLKPKHEYVIKIRLTELQIKLYTHYLENLARQAAVNKGASLFSDYQNLQRAWTHPLVMQMRADRQDDKNMDDENEDSEGSLRDFIDDGDVTESESAASTSSGSASDSDVICEDDGKKRKKKEKGDGRKRYRTRGAVADGEAEEIDAEKENKELSRSTEWWNHLVTSEDLDDIAHSNKLVMLFHILRECEAIGDKLLVFSQSLLSLDLIQRFLAMVDEAQRTNASTDHLCGLTGKWVLGADFFRIDGSTSTDNRTMWCKIFNSPNRPRARLFLISTRAGGLGINMIGANRVILFDASWNPSNDVQSIFRIYRFGQVKPSYVYRFLAAGTMEEKIYDRQVTKLALSGRVVDEHQIDRHFNAADLEELYSFNPRGLGDERPTMMVPKDRLLAELLKDHSDRIESYHEHDSLLENKPEQNLSEEERQAAWQDYETEKNNQANRIANMEAYQQQMLLQQQQQMQMQQLYQQQQAAYNASLPADMPKIDIDMQLALANLVKYAQSSNGNVRGNPGLSGYPGMPRPAGLDTKAMSYVDQQQLMFQQQQSFQRMLAAATTPQTAYNPPRLPMASNSTATIVELSDEEIEPPAKQQPATTVDKDRKAQLKLRQDLF